MQAGNQYRAIITHVSLTLDDKKKWRIIYCLLIILDVRRHDES